MSGDGLTRKEFDKAIAEAMTNFDVMQSDSLTLLLDLDTPAAEEQFNRVYPKVKELFDVTGDEGWTSRNGNRHVRITMSKNLPLPWRVALQAALGSDGIKEVLSLKRFENGIDEPCLLFKPKVV